MNRRAFLVHTLSPLHAGTGHSADLIDLPTARMKGTNIPFLPGSSIKGVLRQMRAEPGDTNRDDVLAAFGPETKHAGEHAGAVVVGDARLLALPVRSFLGTFAWVTSPLLLRLAERDLGWKLPTPDLDERKARVTTTCCCLHDGNLYLEDLDLPASQGDPLVERWATALSKFVADDAPSVFTKRFVVVDDETMSFLMETATQIDARIRMSPQTRTVADGALWLEESLPCETLLVGLMVADRSRRPTLARAPADILQFVLGQETTLQLGGKASVGRGLCRLIPLEPTAPRRP